jgi:hypothetical protein
MMIYLRYIMETKTDCKKKKTCYEMLHRASDFQDVVNTVKNFAFLNGDEFHD